MASLFGLTQQQVDRLAELLRAYESGQISTEPDRDKDHRELQQGNVIVGFLLTAIPGIATLASAPNSGTLKVYYATTTGGTDTQRTENVLHFATVAATTDRWTQAKRDETTGKYVIDFQPCSTT